MSYMKQISIPDISNLLCRVDMRSNHRNGDAVLIHKKGSKVTGIHCNPMQPDILLTCGNDHYVSSSFLYIFKFVFFFFLSEHAC